MEPTRRSLLLAVGATGALAGCLGDNDDEEADEDAADDDDDMVDGDDDDMADGDADSDDAEPETATVDVSGHPDHGDILVDSEGLTLYMFDADEQGADESACYDDCEANWPPLIVEDEPVAGDEVEAELTTFERDDGSMQVAADGWPLYYWVGDEEPGDTAGQGVNDVWWVLEPDGTPIRGAEEPETATVDVSAHPDHGDILVDGDEMTLYMFDADEQGAGESACHDDCADNWPPLLVEDEPVAGEAVAAELTTFEREDGGDQVAADGWPLYYWVGDEEPGDTEGQGVNDVWWVLAPDGTPIRGEDEGSGEDEEDNSDEDGGTDDGGGPGY